MSVRSKCINCGEMKPCLKFEARAPLEHGPVLSWVHDPYTGKSGHEKIEYETWGPMVEVCRECASDKIVALTIVSTLLENL